MTLRAAALALLPLAAQAGEAPDWAGVWAFDPAWCANADRIGAASPAPVRLTADRFEGLENTCRITAAEQVGMQSAWRLVFVCQSEGETYDEETLIMLDGRDTLYRWDGVGAPLAFTRCPRTGQ